MMKNIPLRSFHASPLLNLRSMSECNLPWMSDFLGSCNFTMDGALVDSLLMTLTDVLEYWLFLKSSASDGTSWKFCSSTVSKIRCAKVPLRGLFSHPSYPSKVPR